MFGVWVWAQLPTRAARDNLHGGLSKRPHSIFIASFGEKHGKFRKAKVLKKFKTNLKYFVFYG